MSKDIGVCPNAGICICRIGNLKRRKPECVKLSKTFENGNRIRKIKKNKTT